jgi:acyl-CoA reductase-like NAD-dependent aldehyde dehydrogenase
MDHGILTAPAAASMRTFASYVDGARLPCAGESTFLVDPATGKIWAQSCVDVAAVDLAVESAWTAFGRNDWQGLTSSERAVLLRRLGDLIEANAVELGALESLANGKPQANTIAEMRATAKWYHYYASAIEVRDSHQRELSRTADAFIVREPLGVVLAITPFNGALSLGSWKLAPALAMGNAVILKPPAEAPGSTVRLAELAIEAGLPPGIVNVVIGDAAIGKELVAHKKVAMVSFTGSTEVARKIGAQAGGALKRYVCEAGGKSAHIIFEDADLESAAIGATQGVFTASGQTCVAGSRILVHSSIVERFLELYGALVQTLRLGDPASPQTHLGPISSRRQLDKIRRMVDAAVTQGGRILFDGNLPSNESPGRDGFWFAPTVLGGIRPEMAIWKEEIFGPVSIVQPFDTEEEAISMANDSEFGLAAGFWTKDIHRIRRVSRRLQAGTVWVNTYRAINVRAPFGGYKQSGIGRENGVEALDEFSQIKSVVVEYAPAKNPFSN